VQHLLHGSGGVASAHNSRIGTRLEVLPIIRAGRPAREHLGQPCRALLERRRVGRALGRAAREAGRPSRTPPQLRSDHRDCRRAPLPAPQSRDRPCQTRRTCRRGPRSRCGSPPPDEAHPGIGPASPRHKAAAVSNETATAAALRRIAPPRTEQLSFAWLVPQAGLKGGLAVRGTTVTAPRIPNAVFLIVQPLHRPAGPHESRPPAHRESGHHEHHTQQRSRYARYRARRLPDSARGYR